jgi:hypothetical protein
MFIFSIVSLKHLFKDQFSGKDFSANLESFHVLLFIVKTRHVYLVGFMVSINNIYLGHSMCLVENDTCDIFCIHVGLG